MEEARVFSYHGIDYIHISDFARLTKRSVQSTRRLIENGNKVRKMKFFRDRSRLLIPVVELTGYPLVGPGHSTGIVIISHYKKQEDGTYVAEVCKDCTYGEQLCTAAITANELEVPEGDI